MILSKKVEKQYYTDLDSISVWRWDMLTKTNDYQYICKDGYKPDKMAEGIYLNLVFQFESLNLTSLQDRRDIVVQVIDLILGISETQLDIEEIRIVNKVMQAMIIDPISIPIDFLFNMLKESDLKIQLSFIKLAKKRYIDDNSRQSKQDTLLERVAHVAKVMGTHLDMKAISIVQFLAYEREIYNTKK